ncbi:MAG: hypothetical protein FWB96_00195 [Defluviitaleaceae bacterium]|nr:hypothetical protein [Defluviitaleaceae bacterium]MCL2262538.1 hypothetical protein [Defluviitaleaceae bacterium]
MKAKKFVMFCILCGLLALGMGTTVYAQHVATPTTHRVLLNGRQVQIAGYNIRGTNYFRLRDLAYVLNGTAVQFNVSWDEAARAVRIYSNTPYVPAGGEMQYVPTGATTAIIVDTLFYVDGHEIWLPASGGVTTQSGFTHSEHPFVANIGGNNFVQLRLISTLVGAYVDFMSAHSTILINTNDIRDYYRGLNTAQRFLHNFLETGVSEMYHMALDSNGTLWGWRDDFYRFNDGAAARVHVMVEQVGGLLIIAYTINELNDSTLSIEVDMPGIGFIHSTYKR